MTTITEEYVSFEIAKLLKEKGFNEKCRYYYRDHDKALVSLSLVCGYSVICNKELIEDYAVPTLQVAMKWLREVQNLFVFPFPQMNTNKFWTEIYQLSNNQEWENLYCKSIDLQDYPTYEEACEAAIKYCLVHLI